MRCEVAALRKTAGQQLEQSVPHSLGCGSHAKQAQQLVHQRGVEVERRQRLEQASHSIKRGAHAHASPFPGRGLDWLGRRWLQSARVRGRAGGPGWRGSPCPVPAACCRTTSRSQLFARKRNKPPAAARRIAEIELKYESKYFLKLFYALYTVYFLLYDVWNEEDDQRILIIYTFSWWYPCGCDGCCPVGGACVALACVRAELREGPGAGPGRGAGQARSSRPVYSILDPVAAASAPCWEAAAGNIPPRPLRSRPVPAPTRSPPHQPPHTVSSALLQKYQNKTT